MSRTIHRRKSSRLSASQGESDGVRWPRPIHDFPEIPLDLTSLSDDTLMEIFAVYTAWWNYAAAELASAEIEEMKAESNLRYIQATALVGGWDPGARDNRVTVAKAERDISKPVVDAEERLLLAKTTRKLQGVINANCERCTQLVSREVTRRGNREPYDRRVGRMRP